MDDAHFGTLISNLTKNRITSKNQVTISLLFSDGKNSDQLRTISELRNCGSQLLGS